MKTVSAPEYKGEPGLHVGEKDPVTSSCPFDPKAEINQKPKETPELPPYPFPFWI